MEPSFLRNREVVSFFKATSLLLDVYSVAGIAFAFTVFIYQCHSGNLVVKDGNDELLVLMDISAFVCGSIWAFCLPARILIFIIFFKASQGLLWKTFVFNVSLQLMTPFFVFLRALGLAV